MSEPLHLIETTHPDKTAGDLFKNLIGIDYQKNELISTIRFFFDKEMIQNWKRQHHQNGLPFVDRVSSQLPLVILSGEVGCGKTALANSAGTPIAKELKKQLLCFETPSNVRGTGKVGELSMRITSAFEQAKAKVVGQKLGLLIIDEGDDLATSRSQNQAHHEDRAGLNVLLKQIDSISRERANLVVILITNRVGVLDPAIVRRASLQLEFRRPSDEERKEVFQYLFRGTGLSELDLESLVRASKRESVPFSYSDLIDQIAKRAVIRAVFEDKPFNHKLYLEVLQESKPSPLSE